MKHIVLVTDAERLKNPTLVRRLQWLFPECDIQIVAFTDDRQPVPHPEEEPRHR